MRPIEIVIDPADADATGFASNATGAAFTLAASDAGDGLAHQVSIKNDSTTDHSDKTVTLVGTDSDGKAQTEVVTGPGPSATVESTLYFKTLTSATPSATIDSDTFDIGWVDEVASPTVPLDYVTGHSFASVAVDVSGTISYSAQQSFSQIQNPPADPQQDASWYDIDPLFGETTDATGHATESATAVRLIVNSYSSGASLKFQIVQGSRV